MTPRLQRHSKIQTGYRLSPDLEKKMNTLVEEGEFANRADIITAAIRFWIEYRQFDVKAAVREYLQSEEGRELIAEIMKKRTLKK